MSKVINKNDIILRLKNIDDFNKEYEIVEESIKFVTKKANFKHTICGTDFSMTIKDFIYGQRCPTCAAILRKEKNKKPLSDSEHAKIKEIGYEILEYNGYTKINTFKNIATGDIVSCKISNILKNNITNISHDNKSLKPIEYYIEKQNKIYGNNIRVYEESFINSITKTKFHCNICNIDFYKKYSDLLYNKQGCPECSKNRYYKNSEKILKYIEDNDFTIISAKENLKKITQTTKISLRCNKCGKEYSKSYSDIAYNDSRCICEKDISFSKGERYIRSFLENNNIPFRYNHIISDLEYRSYLRLDFFIERENEKICIEYDGSQHFSENSFFSDSLYIIRDRDTCKNKYCLDNEIMIIRISYRNNTLEKISNILNHIILDGKPYDGKLSRTVWIGGKSNINSCTYDEYVDFNK